MAAKAKSQPTSLPAIYLEGTVDKNDWAQCKVTIKDSGKLIGGDAEYGKSDVSFRFQGSGDKDMKKKDSFRLKFNKKQQFFNNGKYKQWVLSSNDDDPTMARNALAFELSKDLGLAFTPEYQFVDLYLNDKYWGTYQLCDRVNAKEGRALVKGGNEDKDWYVQLADKDEVDEEGDEAIEGTLKAPYIIPKDPDVADMKADDKKTLLKEMKNWFQNTCFTSDFKNQVNQEQFIKWYIAQEILCTWKGLSAVDAYRSVTATDKLLYFGPLWDSEKSFGNNDTTDPTEQYKVIDMSDKDTKGSYEGLIIQYAKYDVMRHIIKNMWLQDWFASGVVKEWETLYGDKKTKDLKTLMHNHLTTIVNAIKDSQAKNYTDGGGSGWKMKNATSFDEAVKSLDAYIDTRLAYLDVKFHDLNENRVLVFNVKKKDALEAWAQTDGLAATVSIKNRGTIHGGEWNMLCLPFNLDRTGIEKVFGQGVQVRSFASVKTDPTIVTYYFTPVESIEHATPYIIRPTQDVTELTFENVTFNAEAAKTVTKDGFQLHGTLDEVTLTAGKTTQFLARNNEVMHLTENSDMNGCRGWFEVPESQSAKAATFGMDETNGIGNIAAYEREETVIYTLGGQRLSATSLNTLPCGMYIINGKKVVR